MELNHHQPLVAFRSLFFYIGETFQTGNAERIMQLDLLAIGAHPDDIELCCGGTVAKMVKSGYKVGIVGLTEGELGTRGTRSIRAQEARAAGKILGCVRENLRLADGNIELSDENRLTLIGLYRTYRPSILLLPHSAERH